MLPAVQGTGHSPSKLILHTLDQFVHHGLYEHASRILRPLRNFALQRQQGADQLNIRLHAGQNLRLKQQLFPTLAFHCIMLNYRDDIFRKKSPDIPEPLGKPGNGFASPRPAALGACA
ncbi:hypothetical protein D3C76_1561290 [compost metagenome]